MNENNNETEIVNDINLMNETDIVNDINVINVTINFQTKKTTIMNNVMLTVNDYNSTKIVFNFDRQDGIKVFEMKNPKGDLIFLDEVIDNEVLLGGKTEDGQPASLFATPGKYVFEVSLYKNDSKLTSASGSLTAEDEKVLTESETLDQYLPLIERLTNLPEIHDGRYLFQYGYRINTFENIINICKNIEKADYMFNNAGSITSLNFGDFDFSTITTADNMFRSCSKLQIINTNKPINLSNLKNANFMFGNCNVLKEINFDTSPNYIINNPGSMFSDCPSLVSLDLSWIYSDKITRFYHMFYNCSSLKSLDISNMIISNATDFGYMFYNCSSLTSLDLSHWTDSKMTTLVGAFEKCSSLVSLNISNLKTTNLNSLANAFQDCSSLVSLDLSKWTTPVLTNMSNAFRNCSSLTSLDLNKWNPKKMTSIYGAFAGCSSLKTLDFSSLNTSYLDSWRETFKGCENLENLKIKFQRGNSDLTKCPDLSECPKLTSESIAYILQNLRAYTTPSATYTIKLGEVNLAKATQADLDAAAAKGWTIK